jgi:hypothetical protein
MPTRHPGTGRRAERLFDGSPRENALRNWLISDLGSPGRSCLLRLRWITFSEATAIRCEMKTTRRLFFRQLIAISSIAAETATATGDFGRLWRSRDGYMKKKIFARERIALPHCSAEYMQWECGCSRIIFPDGEIEINRKTCGNDHEDAADGEKRWPDKGDFTVKADRTSSSPAKVLSVS